MNKKGKEGGIGTILMVFVAIIIGVTLFVTIAQIVGTATSTVAVANTSLGVASNSTTVYLTDYRSIASPVIYNNTGAIVPSTDYIVTNNVVYNGALAVSVLPVSAAEAGFTGYQWNISGTAEPVTYIGGAGRSIALLIPILFALVIAVLALEPTMRSRVLEMMGK